MHYDVNMVWVVEGSCCAVVRGIIEIPLRRSLVPDELIELSEIFRIARLADLSCEIILVPKCACTLGRQWCLVARRTADQIAADGNDRLAAFRPSYCHDVRCARAPVKAGDDGFPNSECVHKGDNVEANGRLLSIAHSCTGKKGCRA